MDEIKLRDVPEQRVVIEARTVDEAQLTDWLPGAMGRVAARAAGDALRLSAQPWLDRGPDEPVVFLVFFEGNPNEGPTLVEVGAPVAAGGDRTEPAHREAYVRVTKGRVVSGRLGEVYQGLEKWAGEQGLRIVAAPREVYWTDFMSAGEDDLVFDVAFPVA
jgi:hypothetical protein